MNRVKYLISRVDGWKSTIEDVQLLLDMAMENPSESSKRFINQSDLLICINIPFWVDTCLEEAKTILSRCEADLDNFEVERLLSGKYDKYSCTICINSGAGGTG